MKKRYFLVILLSIICFSTQLIIGYFTNGDFLYRFIIYAFSCFLIPLIALKYLKKISKNSVLIIFLIPLLFAFLVTVYVYIFENLQSGLPITLVGVISLFTAFYISKFKNIKKLSFFYSFIILIFFYGYFNWLLGKDEIVDNSKFSNELQIKDSNDNNFNFTNKKGKVLVLDLWSTTCSICFKEFPEFEKQYLKYKNDTKVELYSLYLPLKRDSLIDIKSMVKKYSFDKLYSYNLESWGILDNSSVPKIIIIDKNGKVRYKGNMNTNKYLIYNNFNSLIEKLKNE